MLKNTKRPYNYTVCQNVLRNLLADLEVLSGDKVAEGGAAMRDVLGTALTNASVLASQLEAAYQSNVSQGPLVFPSPNDRE